MSRLNLCLCVTPFLSQEGQWSLVETCPHPDSHSLGSLLITPPGISWIPVWLSVHPSPLNHTSSHPQPGGVGLRFTSRWTREFWNGMIIGENITHVWPPLCPKSYGPHLTEVAVSHPVCYINWFGRRPSPRWERGEKKKLNVMPADTSWRPSPLLTPGALGGVWCSTSQPTATQISPRLFFLTEGGEQREMWNTENTMVCGARIETTPPPMFGENSED